MKKNLTLYAVFGLTEGSILRYDESKGELVGITVIGIKSKLLKGLSENMKNALLNSE